MVRTRTPVRSRRVGRHSWRAPRLLPAAVSCAAVSCACLTGVVGVPGAQATPTTAGTPAADIPAADGARIEHVCAPAEAALAEVSGLAVLGGPDGDEVFAIGDSGTAPAVFRVDPTSPDCRTLGTVPLPSATDVEDLAVGPDGRLWVADIGDNAGARESVTVTVLDPVTGAARTHTVRYPSRAADAETLLVPPRPGDPAVVVTKPLVGAATVFRLDGIDPDPAPSGDGPAIVAARAGAVTVAPTDTPGGPFPGASAWITGGSVCPSGRTAVVRTYTDAYVYDVRDGDLASAVTGAPRLRIPLPDEPQGEAVACTASGDLWVASEAGAGRPASIGVVRSVVPDAAAAPGHPGSVGSAGSDRGSASEQPSASEQRSGADGVGNEVEGEGGLPTGVAVAIGVSVLAAVIGAVTAVVVTRSRRRR